MDFALLARAGRAALEGKRAGAASAPQPHMRLVPSDGQITLRDFLVRKTIERAGQFIDQEFSLNFEVRIFHGGGVPGRGLEPLRIAPPDPKSGASANFATLAFCGRPTLAQFAVNVSLGEAGAAEEIRGRDSPEADRPPNS